MLSINPSYTGGMSGCPECQYCRYLQCHGNSPGCRGGPPWLCPLQHCGHTTPRASPVALLFPLDLHRPLNDYSFPLQLPFRQHTTDENKEVNAELNSMVPKEYKKVLENYASNSKFHNQVNNCDFIQRELKIQNNNQTPQQEPCKNNVQQNLKPQRNNKVATVNKGIVDFEDQKPKHYNRHLETQAVHLPAIPEGIGIDFDVTGMPYSKPIDIPKVTGPQHKDHTRRKLDDQSPRASPTFSTNTKHRKKLMDINTCTVSQINQWSTKVLNPQNIKQTKSNKKDEDKSTGYMMTASPNENQDFSVKEPYLLQAHVNYNGNQISSTQTVSPIPKSILKDEITESEMKDYLTSYKVNQNIKLNDKRINEGFYTVKPSLPQKGIDNNQLHLDVKSPINLSPRPVSSFQKDSGNCSDVSSSSANLGGDKSILSSSIKPHCSIPDYTIGSRVSEVHKDLVATAVGGNVSGEDPELGAYWELLEEDIRPVQPLTHSHLSHQIFVEHKQMARNYLILQQELFNLQRQKLLLKEKLSHSEQLEQCTNHRYQEKIKQLMGKRDSLSNNHAHLKQQLERIRSQEKRPLQFSKATPQDITVGASRQLLHPPP